MSAAELSPTAKAGEAGFTLCNACHNPDLSPPLAPPMWGVQRRYKMAYGDKEQFISSVVGFVKNPDKDKAVMKRPVEIMGLMPAQDLPKEQLVKIATFIYENSFAPPCAHWSNAVNKAEAEGHVDGHIQKDKRMLQRFCQ